eukprot:6143891-Ditylum_brightwellii.AAC.1
MDRQERWECSSGCPIRQGAVPHPYGMLPLSGAPSSAYMSTKATGSVGGWPGANGDCAGFAATKTAKPWPRP